MLHVVKRTVLTNEASRQTTAMNLRLPCVTSCEHHAKTRWHQGSNAKFFPSNMLNWLRVCPTPLLKATWGNSNLRGGRFVFHTGYEICFVSGPDTPLFFWLENCEKQDAKIALNCQEACWTLVYIWGSARFVSWDICGPMHDHANPQNPSTWWHQKPHWYRPRLNAYFHQHW